MIHIGEAKNGVSIGTYGLYDGGLDSQKTLDHNRIIGYVQPAGNYPAWILYFTLKGDAFFYTQREPDGSVIGEAIEVKGHGDKDTNQASASSQGEGQDEEPEGRTSAQPATP